MHHDHSSSEAETPATGQQPFVLQVASVKGRGGITTAVGHYARMFERNGVASAVVFRGPAANELRAQGIDVIDAPSLLLSPIAVAFPLQRLRAEVAKRAGGSRLIVLAHSDRALPALRRIFPRAFFITPCHSDKFHHKRGADLVITLNPAQSALARVALPHARIRELGNPYAPLETRPTPTEHASPSEGMPVRFNFLGRLEGFKDSKREIIELRELEDEGDRIAHDAVASLFADGADPLAVIRWKDIHEALEEAVDACDKGANVLEAILVENR